jgi:hypothetical protein
MDSSGSTTRYCRGYGTPERLWLQGCCSLVFAGPFTATHPRLFDAMEKSTLRDLAVARCFRIRDKYDCRD